MASRFSQALFVSAVALLLLFGIGGSAAPPTAQVAATGGGVASEVSVPTTLVMPPPPEQPYEPIWTQPERAATPQEMPPATVDGCLAMNADNPPSVTHTPEELCAVDVTDPPEWLKHFND